MANVVTGLVGFSMRKEFLGGGNIYYRTTTTYDYELFATDFTGWSSTALAQKISGDFTGLYSGNIQCQVFELPADMASINDATRIQKYKAVLEIHNSGDGVTESQSELGTSYYTGAGGSFWGQWGKSFLDFKEDFGFEQNEAGNSVFSHDISFQLQTGNKAAAVAIASGLFSADKDTTFGIAAFTNGAVVGNTGLYQDYFTEVYDIIKQTYHFTKRREILAISGVQSFYNYQHSLDFREDGTCDISEQANIKAALSFNQAQTNVDTLLAGAYTRCNTFYSTYNNVGVGNSTLVSSPVRLTKNFNRNSIEAGYNVSYTNNPNFRSSGVSIDETMELNADEMNFIDIKHTYTFTANRRLAAGTVFYDLIASATGESPAKVATYFQNNASVYDPNNLMHMIKWHTTWPSRATKATAAFEYANSVKYFVTINGVPFNMLDIKVANTKPVDIINEYKVINRPSKTSVLNYAYQTERGQITVTVEGNIGRNPNEFYSGFRTGYSSQLLALYKYGIGVFMNTFVNVTPLAFTYFLSDIRYSLNQDGVLGVTLAFTYTLKKYAI